MAQQVIVTINVEGDITANVRHEVVGIDARDSIQSEIDKSTSKDVEVQPAAAKEKVKFLLITSDTYSEKLKYKIEGGSNDVILDAPQLLMGSGAVGLLEKSPVKIHLTNDMTAKTTVTIYVGRAAS